MQGLCQTVRPSLPVSINSTQIEHCDSGKISNRFGVDGIPIFDCKSYRVFASLFFNRNGTCQMLIQNDLIAGSE